MTSPFLTKHGGDLLERRTAIFSQCERYRYLLKIEWDSAGSLLQVIGLNPSTADEMKDDPTLKRCKDFARRWGHGGLLMTNLFAFRATEPKVMKAYPMPVGESDFNNGMLFDSATDAKQILCAWGKDGEFLSRGAQVREALDKLGHELHCFKLCQNGEPYHPLYMAAATPTVNFNPHKLSCPKN